MTDRDRPLAVRLAAHAGNHSESREICHEAIHQLLDRSVHIAELEARVRQLEHQLAQHQRPTT